MTSLDSDAEDSVFEYVMTLSRARIDGLTFSPDENVPVKESKCAVLNNSTINPLHVQQTPEISECSQSSQREDKGHEWFTWKIIDPSVGCHYCRIRRVTVSWFLAINYIVNVVVLICLCS